MSGRTGRFLGAGAAAAVLAALGYAWFGAQDAPESPPDPPRQAAPEPAPAPDPEPAPAPETETPAPPPESEAAAEPDPAPAPVLPSPRFDIVRVDAQGGTVVAGIAAAGARVYILVDGVETAEALADRRGSFVSLFTLPESAAPRVLTLEALLDDGKRLESEETVLLAPTLQVAEAEPEPRLPAAPEDAADAGTAETGDLVTEDAAAPAASGVEPDPAPADEPEDLRIAAAPQQSAPEPSPAPEAEPASASDAETPEEADDPPTAAATPTAPPGVDGVEALSDAAPSSTEPRADEAEPVEAAAPPPAPDMVAALPPVPALDPVTRADAGLSGDIAAADQVRQQDPEASAPAARLDTAAQSDTVVSPVATVPETGAADQIGETADAPETPADTAPAPSESAPEPEAGASPEAADLAGEAAAAPEMPADAAPAPSESAPEPEAEAVPEADDRAGETADAAESPADAAPAPSEGAPEPEQVPAHTTPEPEPSEPAEPEATPVDTSPPDAAPAPPRPLPPADPSRELTEPDRPAADGRIEVAGSPRVQSPEAAPATPLPGGGTAAAPGRVPELGISPPEALAELPEGAAPGAPGDAAPPPAPAPAQTPAIIMASGDSVRVVQSPTGDRPPEVLRNVVIETISYSPGGDVVLAGRGRTERAVRLYLDNRPLGEFPVGEDGSWRADLPDIDTGIYSLRADEIDSSGRVTSRFETPFQREAPDIVAAAAAASAQAPERGARAEIITVQPGHTLWGISRRTYGRGILYVHVFEANRDQIRNPDLIYPGQIFSLPEINPDTAPAQP